MSSEIIELAAGDDTRFFVHRDILVYQSQPFSDALTGEWREATDHRIDMTDWDSETVSRLVQFLYTGDYHYPAPAPVSPTPLQPKLADEPVPERTDEPSPLLNRPLTPLEKCVAVAMPPGIDDHVGDPPWLDEKTSPAGLNFKETLLAHAKVYVIAHYKSIAALKALAQRRLSTIILKLHPLRPDPHLTMNIVDLVIYVYAHTDSLSNSEEPLRKIVSQFVAFNFSTWYTHPEAAGLMGDGGDFVKDVLSKMCRILQGATRNVASAGTQFIKGLRVSIFRLQTVW